MTMTPKVVTHYDIIYGLRNKQRRPIGYQVNASVFKQPFKRRFSGMSLRRSSKHISTAEETTLFRVLCCKEDSFNLTICKISFKRFANFTARAAMVRPVLPYAVPEAQRQSKRTTSNNRLIQDFCLLLTGQSQWERTENEHH